MCTKKSSFVGSHWIVECTESNYHCRYFVAVTWCFSVPTMFIIWIAKSISDFANNKNLSKNDKSSNLGPPYTKGNVM